MSPPREPSVDRIAALRLNVRDLEAMRAFYVEALGFTPADGAAGDRAVLRMGGLALQLVRGEGRGYPEPRGANDPWFQHFAIAVSDMDAAYARLCEHGQAPISRGGPQHLPPSSGSVTAYKFRDPEGHPLELSYIPGSDWLREPSAAGPFRGVDHSALAAADLEASVAFYAGLGFAVRDRLLNRGDAQDRLDGLDGVSLQIVTLYPPAGGPHIELLHYESPRPPPARAWALDDLVATRILLHEPGGRPRTVRDPDGHVVEVVA